MAYKLYPPTLAGTVPPFFKESDGTSIEVPFSMNRLVSINSVGAMWLRIRDANTDIELGVFSNSDIYNDQTKGCWIAKFTLTSIQQSLLIGNYYKIQIAYEDRETMDAGTTPGSGIIGYYSTIAITKCTIKPTVYIAALDPLMSNTNTSQYVGTYRSDKDPSEKNHQYMFELVNAAGTVLTTTGWQYHNANRDTYSYESTDIYNLIYDLGSSEVVKLKYKVKTNNGLILESESYSIVERGGINSSITAKLTAELDYDNGCIQISLEPDQVAMIAQGSLNGTTNTSYVGRFVLSRSSSIDNYNIWLPLYSFDLTGNLPSGSLFRDFTGIQGETYQYCIQQYNNNNVYSARIYTQKVLMQFEDCFLYDGERQLRIRFNPKITSFKTVVQESKKTTLGAQYPFFFKSGNVAYKEFPISGLISYMMDEQQYFLSRENDLQMPVNWDDSFDITDDNLTYERRFRLAVLDWLNNGEIKIFRSPAEGNYIVRLMGVSLSPNDSVSRMIATFSCTATETAAYTTENLTNLGFLDVDLTVPQVLQFYTINLTELTTGSETMAQIKNKDLLQGFSCQYIKIEGVDPLGINGSTTSSFSLNKNSTNRNSTAFFSFGGTNGDPLETYTVGITGQYEATFQESKRVLKLVNPYQGMPGTITVGILVQNTSWFDDIKEVNSVDRFDCYGPLGRNWIAMHQGDHPDSWGGSDYYNSKDTITKIYLAQFDLNRDVYQVESLQEIANTYNLYMTPSATAYNQTHPEYPHNTYTQYEVQHISNQRKPSDLFITGAVFICQHTFDNRGNDEGMSVWEFYSNNANVTTPSNSSTFGWFKRVNNQTIKTETGEYITLLPTQIYIDGELFDIGQTGRLRIENFSSVPHVIQWGNEVKGLFFYRIDTLSYEIEQNTTFSNTLAVPYAKYEYARKFAAANRNDQGNYGMQLRRYTSKISKTDSKGRERSFYIWNNGVFKQLTPAQYDNYAGEYWCTASTLSSPWPDVDISFNNNESVTIGGRSYSRNTLIQNLDNYAKEYFDLLNTQLETQKVSYDENNNGE